MLNLLDQTIRAVLDTGWTATPPPAKPGFFFTVPDEDWRRRVREAPELRLNIYLYEVRENRDFRRSEWDVIELADHSVVRSAPPAYFDCHYLITAWSPAEDSEALNPVLDEHQVLGEALRVLLRSPDVRPMDLGVAGGGPVFQQAHIWLSVAPPEAPRTLNDFWSTMKLPWRPAIQLVATAPVDLLQDSAPAAQVLTLVQRYGVIGGAGSAEEWITIGGWVLRDADDSPIGEATVRRLSGAGEVLDETRTDAAGRFTLTGLRPGINHLQVEAAGFAVIDRDLDLPNELPDEHVFRLI